MLGGVGGCWHDRSSPGLGCTNLARPRIGSRNCSNRPNEKPRSGLRGSFAEHEPTSFYRFAWAGSNNSHLDPFRHAIFFRDCVVERFLVVFLKRKNYLGRLAEQPYWVCALGCRINACGMNRNEEIDRDNQPESAVPKFLPTASVVFWATTKIHECSHFLTNNERIIRTTSTTTLSLSPSRIDSLIVTSWLTDIDCAYICHQWTERTHTTFINLVTHFSDTIQIRSRLAS